MRSIVRALIAEAACIAIQFALCVVEHNYIARIVRNIYHLITIGIDIKIGFIDLPFRHQRLYMRFDADIYQLFMNFSFLLFVHAAKIKDAVNKKSRCRPLQAGKFVVCKG